MRGIPRDRPEALGTQESLTQEQFVERATHAADRQRRAPRLPRRSSRNEWGTRMFGFTSLVVDPPNGRTPALNDCRRARARLLRRVEARSARTSSTRSTTSRCYDRCIGARHQRAAWAP